MNLEEFDHKLNDAFKNEYLPPNEKLWQNISGRLDQKKKRPFWYWLMPVTVVFIAATAWFFSGEKTTKSPNIANNNINNSLKNNSIVQNQQNITTNKNTVNNTEFNQSDSGKETFLSYPLVALKYSEEENKNIDKTTKYTKQRNTNSENLSTNNPLAKLTNSLTSSVTTSEIINFEESYFSFNLYKFRKIPTLAFINPIQELINYEPNIKNKINTNNKKTGVSKDRTADFDKKWLWNFGIGPQLCINNINIDEALKPKVHIHLWENKNMLTRNSTGFQSQFLVSRKINSHFSIESGLQYSLRGEYIRLNEESDSIAFRSADGTIGDYKRVVLLALLYNKTTGKYDTTRYNAIQAFTLIQNNKYHAFTVPIKFNSEFNISQNTKFQFGLGLGFTYMYAKKTTHFDIVKEERITQNKKSLFGASFNTQIAFFTNFNNMGEIGVYTGFQGYANKWGVINKQYSIGMSDMQLGFCFRRPF